MKLSTKKKLIILIIFFVIFLIYGYFLVLNKGSIKTEQSTNTNLLDNKNIKTTKFTNVEYKFFTKNEKEFVTLGKEAIINKDDPELIHIKKAYSFTKTNDGTLLEIKSNSANYDKKTKNISYIEKVLITNKNDKIFCDIAEYIQEKNLILLKKNVKFQNQTIEIKGDLVKFDVHTKNIEISMNKFNDQVYGKKKN